MVRSVGNLTGPGPGRGLGHGRIRRAEGTGVSVGRYSDPPYLPFAKAGGSCARGSLVDGGIHVSSGGGSTPPCAEVGARWRSMHVRFVTNVKQLR